MNIAVLLESKYSGGGSFSHSVNATIDLIKYSKFAKNVVIYTSHADNLKILRKLKLPVVLFSYNLVDIILIKICNIKVIRFFFYLTGYKISLEETLFKSKVDLLYFPVLSDLVFCLRKINYISTVLDLCHFQHSIFPEISKKVYQYKEKLYKFSLNRSAIIITSCASLKEKISNHYKIAKSLIVLIPYMPSYLFNSSSKRNNILKTKYRNLKNIFFYPAQIWAHKNHITILKAAKILQNKNYKINFVFSGKDRGYQNVLNEFIKKNKLTNVYFTKYLTSAEMHCFYKKCKGVIYASLLGPNNIPPLETWSYKKPLIHNNIMLDDVPKNTAITINIKDPKELSLAIIKIIKNKYNKKIITNGTFELKKRKNLNKLSYSVLDRNIDNLKFKKKLKN